MLCGGDRMGRTPGLAVPASSAPRASTAAGGETESPVFTPVRSCHFLICPRRFPGSRTIREQISD